jgi:acyl carrier protein
MIPDKREIVSKLKAMVAERLNLSVKPEEIGDDQPLFDPEQPGSLGLDSVEALEIVCGVEDLFGVRVEDDEGVAQRFHSVNTLADYVIEMMAKEDAAPV